MDDTLFTQTKPSIKPEICSIYALYNDVQFKMSKLFIDTREPKHYHTRHVRSAVNIPFNSDVFRSDCNSFESKINSFIARKVYSVSKIIWYGNMEFDANNKRQALFYQRCSEMIIQSIQTKSKKKLHLNAFHDTNDAPVSPKVYVLGCEYGAFETKYPFLCDNKQSSADPNTDSNSAKSELLLDFLSIYMNRKINIKDCLKVYPSQIIDDQYFLGNAGQSNDLKLLKNLGITHVINCTQTLDNPFEDTIKYIRVPVQDVASESIKPYLIDAIQFIETALSVNDGVDGIQNKILCHCHAGISRSTSVTIAYLMYAEQVSFLDALAYAKSRRQICRPNLGFRTQLCEFEKFLNATRLALNKKKLNVSDLSDFMTSDLDGDNGRNISNNSAFLYKELKQCVHAYFMSVNYDDVYCFFDKYGCVLRDQLHMCSLCGFLIEDILMNENNCNRQLFILLMVELFESKTISNLMDDFGENVLCKFIAQRIHDNVMDCPYYLQFIGALFGHLLAYEHVLPACLVSFCESSIKYHKVKLLTDNVGDKECIQKQFDLVRFQCSKLILYTFKELELLDSDIISQFQQINLRDLIVSRAFDSLNERYLTYIT
eukprot:186557_1